MSTSDFIVVQHFYDATELTLAQRQLQNAGIPTQARDVFSLQTFTTFEARSFGGAKLLVPQKDYHRASSLLIEGGFMKYNPSPQTFRLTQVLDEWAMLLPGVGRLSRELRLVAIGFVLLSLIFSISIIVLLLK